jgi:signal transduction histidine kinase
LPLAHFAAEAAEVARGIRLITLGSGLFAVLIALIATRRAFAPLRHATALLGNVDAGHLGHRLPTRGTADPVDRHAEVLNQVLSTIDSSFARLRAFSSDAAHELRTPLHRIGSVAEVALLREAAEDLRPALESVHATSQELSRLIQALLLLAELDDEHFVLKRSPVDARALIARSAEVYGPLFEERGMKLNVESDEASVEGDSLLLDRVLANLLDNALRHTPPGGQVEIRGVRAEAGFRISVDDAGTGVPGEERERIFDRFARLEGTRDSPGAGLGLALARAIARVHGGDLTVEDSPLFGGSRFVWWLAGRGSPRSP